MYLVLSFYKIGTWRTFLAYFISVTFFVVVLIYIVERFYPESTGSLRVQVRPKCLPKTWRSSIRRSYWNVTQKWCCNNWRWYHEWTIPWERWILNRNNGVFQINWRCCHHFGSGFNVILRPACSINGRGFLSILELLIKLFMLIIISISSTDFVNCHDYYMSQMQSQWE